MNLVSCARFSKVLAGRVYWQAAKPGDVNLRRDQKSHLRFSETLRTT